VRNGHLSARDLQTPIGPICVQSPRVDDRRTDEQGQRVFRFTSSILPRYLRKSKSIEKLVPWLYLKGISSSDFPQALSALGLDGSGLSASSVIRMKELWRVDETFQRDYRIGIRYTIRSPSKAAGVRLATRRCA
jgi:putative transposase